jgi:hypothetical protein
VTRWARCTKASSGQRQAAMRDAVRGARCEVRVRCSGSRARHRGFSADEQQLVGSRVAVDVVCFAARRSNQQSGMRLVPALAGSPCRPATPQQDAIFAVAVNCSTVSRRRNRCNLSVSPGCRHTRTLTLHSALSPCLPVAYNGSSLKCVAVNMPPSQPMAPGMHAPRPPWPP